MIGLFKRIKEMIEYYNLHLLETEDSSNLIKDFINSNQDKISKELLMDIILIFKQILDVSIKYDLEFIRIVPKDLLNIKFYNYSLDEELQKYKINNEFFGIPESIIDKELKNNKDKYKDLVTKSIIKLYEVYI